MTSFRTIARALALTALTSAVAMAEAPAAPAAPAAARATVTFTGLLEAETTADLGRRYQLNRQTCSEYVQGVQPAKTPDGQDTPQPVMGSVCEGPRAEFVVHQMQSGQVAVMYGITTTSLLGLKQLPGGAQVPNRKVETVEGMVTGEPGKPLAISGTTATITVTLDQPAS